MTVGDYTKHVVIAHMGHCVPDGHWCTAHDAMRYGQSPVCSRFVEAEEIAAAALRMFAKHDIHDVLPHGDIANSWYHSGLDAAQAEALIWAGDDDE